VATIVYSAATWFAMAIYGVEQWADRGEAFSVYFNLSPGCRSSSEGTTASGCARRSRACHSSIGHPAPSPWSA
jgi:hypothetical protein